MNRFLPKILFSLLCFFLFNAALGDVEAATLKLSPETGVYSVGGTFTARVVINTAGKAVNAAEGKLSYNPRELSVVAVSRSSSIFNLWTQEPTYSNSAGTISFGGGSPSGYTGSAGTVMIVTFRTLNAGSPKVTFSSGSVLAADGLGTNVLTNMSGASYTVNAPTENPEPEYIAPANTPGAPTVTSDTHPDPNGWYNATAAHLSWSLPSGVTAIRTLLDEHSGTIPTILYDEPITERTIEDLPQGVSYFHIQFKNSDGWGKVTHRRIAVDTEEPSSFTIAEAPDQDIANPERKLVFTIEDVSPVTTYLVQIDGGDPVEYLDQEETREYTLPHLAPGRHTVIAEAFDAAGNSTIATYGFDIASFDKPVFTEYPTRLTNEVVPVFKGSTRPNAKIRIEITQTGSEAVVYEVTSDDAGAFVFIPDGRFGLGVYDVVAVATDEFGAQSDPSEAIRFVVEEPGYVAIGSLVISVLSIVVPLIALLVLLVFGMWYLWHRLRRWRRRVSKEALEAEERLRLEFDEITRNLGANISKLKKSRKGKLTKAETALIDQIEEDVTDARAKIRKEIEDIENMVS